MNKKGLLSALLAASLIFISSLVFVGRADAVSLQYQVLQPNGQTSHADQYMDKPANVIIQDGKYYVSMSSSVPAWIGSHPVTYTSINNGDGQIVNNAHGASFKFSTTNLSKLIPVTMHLDVKVANVNMDALVYLKFLNVPALDSGQGANQPNADANNVGNASADGNQPADNKDAGDATKADADEKKVTIKKPVKLNKKDSPKKEKDSNAGSSVIYPDKAKKKSNNKAHYIEIASGVVVLVVAIAAVVYYRSRNKA
ncbi:NEAT domain-containing protein [Companilactobacillus ginsenosidimutans]|uniref:NEAT domain-containing protein n=1 Tax=Companilactobacillus ginsenosidimutans TaxID=1007676 RepID=A0A0H4QED9_9LACO|nr:NEAT domain-containing protein [Companilactobacillus ginsenosidimutans]AKP66302.1 hypothetical protein ABM34_01210 [Companilactobacillus ginsenosidimutans]